MSSQQHTSDAHLRRRSGPRTRRLLTLGIILAAASCVALIASAGAPAKATHTPTTPTTITFFAKSLSQTAPDPSFPRPGDIAAATLANMRHGHLIGGDLTSCVIVDTAANAQCSSTVGLPGGTLEAAFSQNEASTTITGAITGGTGRYTGASGSFTLTRVGTTSNFNAVAHLL
jgi:hypothetical protein